MFLLSLGRSSGRDSYIYNELKHKYTFDDKVGKHLEHNIFSSALEIKGW